MIEKRHAEKVHKLIMSEIIQKRSSASSLATTPHTFVSRLIANLDYTSQGAISNSVVDPCCGTAALGSQAERDYVIVSNRS